MGAIAGQSFSALGAVTLPAAGSGDQSNFAFKRKHLQSVHGSIQLHFELIQAGFDAFFSTFIQRRHLLCKGKR